MSEAGESKAFDRESCYSKSCDTRARGS